MSVKIEVVVGFLPVITFLAVLLYLDSYKLIRLREVLAVLVCGALAAGASYFTNASVVDATHMSVATLSRYVAPLIEEGWKGLIVVALIRTQRAGFLVDAGIFGFAVGAGFALAENSHFFGTTPDATVGAWFIRGFGPALMHGGATGLFAVIGLALSERTSRFRLLALVPGFVVAVGLHAGFNHLSDWPRVATFSMFVIVPLLSYLAFRYGERATGEWLGKGFDADVEMLAMVRSGNLTGSPLGLYVKTLLEKFKEPAAADILRYLRLYTELAMHAKGILIARESGFDPAIDAPTRRKFKDLRELESKIGKTAMLALEPVLSRNRKNVWQMYVLKE